MAARSERTNRVAISGTSERRQGVGSARSTSWLLCADASGHPCSSRTIRCFFSSEFCQLSFKSVFIRVHPWLIFGSGYAGPCSSVFIRGELSGLTCRGSPAGPAALITATCWRCGRRANISRWLTAARRSSAMPRPACCWSLPPLEGSAGPWPWVVLNLDYSRNVQRPSPDHSRNGSALAALPLCCAEWLCLSAGDAFSVEAAPRQFVQGAAFAIRGQSSESRRHSAQQGGKAASFMNNADYVAAPGSPVKRASLAPHA